MITKKLEEAINDQITAELWSSNLYLQMAFYLEKEGWDGFAHWMYKQSEEEKEHALDMAHYLIKRGGEAKVAMIDVVPAGWGSVLEVFEHVYQHECHVSELVNTGILTPMQMAEKMSFNPARILGIDRGTLCEGAQADVTVIDPEEEYTIDKESFVSKSRNTPFHGRRVHGRVKVTIVAGTPVFEA